MTKLIMNWMVFAASALYGLWAFGKLFSVLFNLGENGTALATLSLIVFGLAPFPTSFMVLRWRRIGALVFVAIAALLVAGFVDDDFYISARNGTAVNTHQLAVSLVAPVAPLLLFAAFYLTTDILRWPKMKPTTVITG